MRLRALALTCVLLACLAACSSKADRRDKMFARAQALLAKGDYAAAESQVKKALDIDPQFAKGYGLLGRVQFRRQEFQPARASLEKAVELDPGLLEEQLTLGELYMMSGRATWADAKADIVLAKGQRMEAMLLKAAVERSGGQLDEALGWCRKAITRQPDRPEPYLLAAEIEVQAGKPGAARKLLTEGSAKVPDDLPLQVSLAQVYVGEKKTTQAEKTVAALVAKHPKEAKLRLLLAEYYGRQGKSRQAEAELRRAVQLKPDQEALQVQLADFLLAAGKRTEAEHRLKDALALCKPGYVLRARLARLYGATGRLDEALATYRAAVALDPKAPEARALRKEMALLCLDHGRPEEALSEAKELLSANAEDMGALLLEGRALLARGEAPKAAGVLDKVVKAQPEAAETYIWLARAHAAADQPALARQTLKQGVEAVPENAALKRALARAYMAAGELDAARAELEQALKADPEDAAALGDLGAVHVAQDDMNQAELCFKKLVRLHPKSYDGHYRLGLLAAHQRHYDEAVRQLKKAAELAPDSGLVAAALVRAYLAQGKPAEARTWIEERLEARPKDAWLHGLAGELDMAAGETAGAEEQFEAAQRLAPEWRLPYDSLAALYGRTGQVKEAAARLQKSFGVTGSATSGFMLGVLQEIQGDWEAARQTYGRLLAEQPGFALGAANLAFLLAEHDGGRKALSEADRLARAALAKAPDDAFFLDTAGWVAYRRGETDRARGLLERALAQQPEAAIFNYHVGMLYLKSGRLEEGKRHLRQAVESGQRFMGLEDARKALGKTAG